jgi:hypothetical protein
MTDAQMETLKGLRKTYPRAKRWGSTTASEVQEIQNLMTAAGKGFDVFATVLYATQARWAGKEAQFGETMVHLRETMETYQRKSLERAATR